MKQLVIRGMEEKDMGQVVQIERVSFSFPWSEVSFSKELYKPHSIPKVAVVGDKVVGYVCAECVVDEGHVLNLAVHPDFRKMDIATSLVSHIIEELKLKGCKFLYLEVRASNQVARRLYEGFGFKVVGVRKNYYAGPVEDGVIMMFQM